MTAAEWPIVIGSLGVMAAWTGLIAGFIAWVTRIGVKNAMREELSRFSKEESDRFKLAISAAIGEALKKFATEDVAKVFASKELVDGRFALLEQRFIMVERAQLELHNYAHDRIHELIKAAGVYTLLPELVTQFDHQLATILKDHLDIKATIARLEINTGATNHLLAKVTGERELERGRLEGHAAGIAESIAKRL